MMYFLETRCLYGLFQLLITNQIPEDTNTSMETFTLSETDIKVSDDRSWKKHGFTSHYAVTTLLSYYTGKVI